MEEVGQSTPGDSSETVLLEMSQIFIQQLKESRDREIKLQEKIRLLEKEREIQNGTAVSSQQQQHGVQELRQQIAELIQQFRQLKSNSDEKVQRLSNEVARLETEAKDKDAKIKGMTDRENAHPIGGVRTEKDELQKRLDEANAQIERMRVAAYDQQLANRNNRERDRFSAESTAAPELKAQLEKANEENERLKQKLNENEHRLANTQEALNEAEGRIRETGTEDVERKLKEYEESRMELNRLQREIDDLKAANGEAWRQVNDLRKMNDDMNASAAQTIYEKESAVERLNEIAAELRTERSEKSELQTRIRVLLEDNNKMLKDTIELLKGERERAAPHFQLDRETFESWAARLRREAACERESERRRQRYLQNRL